MQEAFGYAVAKAGDVNGDGRADFIVGNYRASPNGFFEAGSVYVYSGANGELFYQLDGDSTNGHFGFSVAGGGDVNGDGVDDLAIGSPEADSGSIRQAGVIFLFSGSSGNLLWKKFGLSSFGHLGASVNMVKDLNSDGKDEFMVGAPRDRVGNTPAGAVYVYSGATGNLLYQFAGTAQSDFFGASLAGAGDINGDGTADFIIGARFADPDTDHSINSGAAYIYSGLDGSLLFSVRGDSEDDWLGYAVAGIGDVNADGQDDFIVGAPNKDALGLSGAGWTGVYSGKDGLLLFELFGDSANDFLGCSVASAGDVNGDGKEDILVGSLGADRNALEDAGSAYVISGLDGSPITRLDGSGFLEEMGYAVAGIGDVNGDGRSDIIISAPMADSSRGVVFVYGSVITDSPEMKNDRPLQFRLSQNYPNPFNPVTTIQYSTPKREKVALEVFNLNGQRVRVLANEEQPAGEHNAVWDGKDERGKTLPSGIYFYRLKGRDFGETKKMILLK